MTGTNWGCLHQMQNQHCHHYSVIPSLSHRRGSQCKDPAAQRRAEMGSSLQAPETAVFHPARDEAEVPFLLQLFLTLEKSRESGRPQASVSRGGLARHSIYTAPCCSHACSCLRLHCKVPEVSSSIPQKDRQSSAMSA